MNKSTVWAIVGILIAVLIIGGIVLVRQREGLTGSIIPGAGSMDIEDFSPTPFFQITAYGARRNCEVEVVSPSVLGIRCNVRGEYKLFSIAEALAAGLIWRVPQERVTFFPGVGHFFPSAPGYSGD